MLTLSDVKSLPNRLNARVTDVTNRVNRKSRRLRNRAQEQVWQTRVGVLERADATVSSIPRLPVLKLLTNAMSNAVRGALETATLVPIEDYDDLNAKSAIKAVRSIDHRGDLMSVRRREADTKARKTVLKAIDDRLASQLVVPVTLAAVPA